MLEHHANSTPRVPQLVGADVGQLLAVYGDGPGGGLVEQGQAADESGFTRSGMSDNAMNFPGRDFKADTIKGNNIFAVLLVDLAQVTNCDH
ncbi:hypothetical protein ANI01nite_12370 [Glutamicibacter nicotianae]|uniref:Uncharacterized protein n=1 Tax=Glutamicibacter nicotianae TaxID=37929 RepID=A0ABQ0RJQ3_GLUNI|nr:hypothetical protein ANI01nite_12370 [Glutamicibacter nicotianae]